jgi:hypothetical protein
MRQKTTISLLCGIVDNTTFVLSPPASGTRSNIPTSLKGRCQTHSINPFYEPISALPLTSVESSFLFSDKTSSLRQIAKKI